ncbi:MAG TPA: hypothetical protein VIA62_22500 [Thermoanaerobaculia bacterium]|nr:hypothetical protein [Thermoanaerobaculia bacterium]
MRKLLLSMGTVLIVTLALVSGVTTARPAWALCYCLSNNDFQTSSWGMGANCTAAQSDLTSHVNADAFADCGGSAYTCLGTLHYTNACWWNGTMFQSDGYRDYSCKVCGQPPPQS